MTNSKVFWGIVTAAATGAVIGMLFAPEEGTNTRRKIKRSANDWATDMLDTLEKNKKKVQEAANRLSTESQRLKETVLNRAESTLNDAESTINSAKETVQNSKSNTNTGTTGTGTGSNSDFTRTNSDF